MGKESPPPETEKTTIKSLADAFFSAWVTINENQEIKQPKRVIGEILQKMGLRNLDPQRLIDQGAFDGYIWVTSGPSLDHHRLRIFREIPQAALRLNALSECYSTLVEDISKAIHRYKTEN